MQMKEEMNLLEHGIGTVYRDHNRIYEIKDIGYRGRGRNKKPYLVVELIENRTRNSGAASLVGCTFEKDPMVSSYFGDMEVIRSSRKSAGIKLDSVAAPSGPTLDTSGLIPIGSEQDKYKGNPTGRKVVSRAKSAARRRRKQKVG